MEWVRLEPAAPRSQVKHSSTEPLRSLGLRSDKRIELQAPVLRARLFSVINLNHLNLCILIDFPIQINEIRMALSVIYFKVPNEKSQ